MRKGAIHQYIVWVGHKLETVEKTSTIISRLPWTLAEPSKTKPLCYLITTLTALRPIGTSTDDLLIWKVLTVNHVHINGWLFRLY